jgi:twitching motility protein PilJ
MVSIEAPKIKRRFHSKLVNPKKHHYSFRQWFSNLPVKSKQLTGLFASEIISVFGLVGVGAVLIVAGGRSQLLDRAESELAVIENIVDGKSTISQKTLDTFDGGYSAIYAYQPSGEFTLAAALTRGEAKDGEAAQANLAIRDQSLLQKAVATPGEPVTDRQELGGQTYTLAAKVLTDSNGKPVAVLVRGTSETAANAILGNSLLLLFGISALALTADVILAILLGKSISQPIEQLQQTTRKFIRGDRKVRAEIATTDEVGQLARTFNQLADGIVDYSETLSEHARLQAATERYQAFARHSSNLYRSLKVEDILNTAVEGARHVIQSDRVVIYSFNPDYQSGVIAAESVAPDWVKAMGQVVQDPLTPEILEKFNAGSISVCNDIRERNLSLCHCKILARLQVRANLVAPILRGNKLVGLLCAHQCSGARTWQPHEIELFQQLATQIGMALSQSYLIGQLERSRQEAELARRQTEAASEQTERARQEAELASIEQQKQTEALQMQMLFLLQDIEDSRMGDLTVRADVTEGTIGTVADFFNALIESLGQLVMQVQLVSSQVNGLLSENEQAVGELSEQALKQAEEIHLALGSVEQMTHSIQEVAKNARQAAEVARFASTTAQTGGEAIDLTVEQIVNLRETVVRTADKVKQLGISSQEIAKVIAIVHDISLKTNLLAINAGVEASRAGQEGEGFRVIAENIGSLAKQSVAATQEIEQVLDVIKKGTREAVESMQEGKTQAIDSTKTILRAKESLEQIFEVSHQINALVQSISSATVSQAQTSQNVTEVMHNIARTSQRTFDSSHTVSNTLQETVEVASQLQESMGQFKIEADS